MDTEGKRVKAIREKLQLSQDKFAEIFSSGKSYISAVENDKSRLSHDSLVKLLLDYQVNINYLLAGIGSPFINTDMQDDFESRVLEILKERGL